MRIETAQRQLGTVYHFTYRAALLKILQSGDLALTIGRAQMAERLHQRGKNFFASLTRSRRGAYHINTDIEIEEDASNDAEGRLMITLDGDGLSNNHQIVPVDYWKRRGSLKPRDASVKEVEERLVSDQPAIPVLKYIKRVDFIQKISNGKTLGSLLIRLKRHRIPYSFYNSMSDWAANKGEFSYIGDKEVNTYGRGFDASRGFELAPMTPAELYSMKALIECISPTPYFLMSKTARLHCKGLMDNTIKTSDLFLNYDRSTTPNSDPVRRALAIKLSRAMKRMNLESKAEASILMADKARLHFS